MKIIHPYVELIKQEPGIDGIYRHIEKCGRICYKSEDKITQDSADAFFNNLLKNRHYAMLEHGTIYLKIDKYYVTYVAWQQIYEKYYHNPYSVVKSSQWFLYITTNYRVIIENNWIDDLQYLCEPTELHIPRITLKFTTNIGVTREGNRHRVMSIAEESTRYCNYTKDKFGNNVSFCKPVWVSEITDNFEENAIDFTDSITNRYALLFIDNCTDIDIYQLALGFAEYFYTILLKKGWTPQQAREVLPLATKSEVVYTAFPNQWKHFFDLRLFGTTGKPHPNMQEIAELAQGVLEENDLWNLIYNPDDKLC